MRKIARKVATGVATGETPELGTDKPGDSPAPPSLILAPPVVRDAAVAVAPDAETPVPVVHYAVDKADVEGYLGLPSYEHEFAERHPQIGVTHRLARTQYGGAVQV